MAGGRTRGIYVYFGALTLLIYLARPDGYLFDIPSAYLLKNQLHATAPQVSTFRLVSAIPVYLAGVLGLVRDLWSPFGLRDRGYFLLFAPLTALAFAAMAVMTPSYAVLLGGTLVAMLAFYFVMTAYQALLALVGQELLISGRLSTLWQTMHMAVTFSGAIGSGQVTAKLSPQQFFYLMAGLAALITVFGAIRPRAVFSHAYDRPIARGSTLMGDLRRLVRHRAVRAALLIHVLWNFLPGINTPLQFHLSNRLHAPDEIYAYSTAIFYVAYLPAMAAYGVLCKRVAMRHLLFWGTIVGIPCMVPFAFVETPTGALWAAVPEGLLSGFASVAFIDLAVRSCPPGLQGTLMMLVHGLAILTFRVSDVVGSWLYGLSEAHGFTYCVAAMTGTYALILPALRLVPKELVATADGEPNPAMDGVGAEVGAAA